MNTAYILRRHCAAAALLALAGVASCGSGTPSATQAETDSAEEVVSIEPDTVASPAVANLHNPLPGLPLPLRLAGNFGELRSNHFHSGVDFKTGGREGARVVSADSGYVSRALVSPWGFGRAVYVTHPRTGLTTVYGHLRAFAPKIDSLVRARQYAEETFSIDVTFDPGEIPLARGEKLGDSGNAGSSGGPHLHMDVRRTSNENPLDPMPYYRHLLDDKARPEVRALALYPVAGKGAVASPTKLLPGKGPYRFAAWGEVYPGIKAYDRMTETSNIYGVKHITLTVDGDTLYTRDVEEFSFDDTRAVHSLVHFPSLRNGGEWIMTTYSPSNNPLAGYMVNAEGSGTIIIDEPRDYACEYVLTDEMGNTTRVPFTITGRSMQPSQSKHRSDGKAFVDRPFRYQAPTLRVEIPAGALYDDLDFSATASAGGTGYYSEIYTVGDATVPLHKGIDISVKVDEAYTGDPGKLVLVRLGANGRPSAVDASYSDGWMKATVRDFGRYAVTTDTTDPVIKKLPSGKGSLAYKITDNLSGIKTYRGEIDGKYALMELDGKTSRLSFDIDKRRFPSTGKAHPVKVTVTDAAGNTAVFSEKVVF